MSNKRALSVVLNGSVLILMAALTLLAFRPSSLNAIPDTGAASRPYVGSGDLRRFEAGAEAGRSYVGFGDLRSLEAGAASSRVYAGMGDLHRLEIKQSGLDAGALDLTQFDAEAASVYRWEAMAKFYKDHGILTQPEP